MRRETQIKFELKSQIRNKSSAKVNEIKSLAVKELLIEYLTLKIIDASPRNTVIGNN